MTSRYADGWKAGIEDVFRLGNALFGDMEAAVQVSRRPGRLEPWHAALCGGRQHDGLAELEYGIGRTPALAIDALHHRLVLKIESQAARLRRVIDTLHGKRQRRRHG